MFSRSFGAYQAGSLCTRRREISLRGRRRVLKGTVLRKLNKLNNKQLQNLRKLAAMPDSEIDTTDIPEWTVEDFDRSVPFSRLYKPRKLQITTRIDADVVEWLKSSESPYQSRLNNILRIAMRAAIKKAAKTSSSRSSSKTFGVKRIPRKATLKPAPRSKRVQQGKAKN